MDQDVSLINFTNPFELFAAWFSQIPQTVEQDPTAMTLATVDQQGLPAARTVLLKAFDERGFVFYTNLQSRKAQALYAKPFAALCFYWASIDKQIRIEGQVEQVTEQEADIYFASRPRGSQIGAWSSLQSQVLTHPDELYKKYQENERHFANQAIPRPNFWSGFRIVPNYFEFWQQGQYRLHTRMCYRKQADNSWQKQYLYP